jgi:Outer membrane lipoprotein-sorting protein
VKIYIIVVGLLAGLVSVWAPTSRAELSPSDIVQRMLAEDPFGLGGAEVSARLVLTEKSGSSTQLAFSARSLRYDPPFSKSVLRFTAPADLAGAGFLQIQNRGGDDDRFLFLPELKRSRRIAGSLRGTSFMGTDFSFADLDRRDLRDGEATSLPDESVGKFACYRIDIATRRSDSPYSRLEGWIRKDNMLPLKLVMYDRTNALLKTFTALEVRRIDGRWFVTRSRMFDHARAHTTELLLEAVAPGSNISADEFTVRNLEKQ